MIYLRHTILNNSLLKIHLKVMRYFGVAIFDDQRFHRVHKFRGFVIMFIWTTFNISQFMDQYDAFGDISKMTTNVGTTVLFLMALSQCYRFLYYRSDLMISLFNEVESNMNKLCANADGNSEKHRQNVRKILNKNVDYANLLTGVFGFLSFVSVNIMAVLAIWRYFYVGDLNAEDRKNVNFLLIRSWYPVDVYEYFIPIYIHQVVNCYIGMVIIPLLQTLIVVFMVHAIAMIQILKYRFETITEDLDDVQTMDDRDIILKRKMRDYIVTQLDLGKFVHNLDKLISPSMFLIFVLYSVLLCVVLFQLSRMEFTAELLVPLIFMVDIIVILLMFYWHANEITYQSNTLPSSIYQCEWYKCSKHFKKLMQIFVTGSQRPMTLSALYFTMSLDVYINILKASYSYFTLLSHISDRG